MNKNMGEGLSNHLLGTICMPSILLYGRPTVHPTELLDRDQWLRSPAAEPQIHRLIPPPPWHFLDGGWMDSMIQQF